jgi:hypothetical protein
MKKEVEVVVCVVCVSGIKELFCQLNIQTLTQHESSLFTPLHTFNYNSQNTHTSKPNFHNSIFLDQQRWYIYKHQRQTSLTSNRINISFSFHSCFSCLFSSPIFSLKMELWLKLMLPRNVLNWDHHHLEFHHRMESFWYL